MDYARVHCILEKYRGSWVVQFSEFLLPPGDAAAFVADLADIDVLLRGCDLWTYLDPEKTKLMEILTGGDVIDDKMSDDVRSNAQVIREFLLHELTPDVHLVSLWYADPDLWDVILQYTTYP